MPDDDKLTPADAEEVAFTLSFALRFDGRKRFQRGDEFMAALTARHLIEHLERSGFVIMKRPPRTWRKAPDSYQG